MRRGSRPRREWLVRKGVKTVGVDTATVDHPLATSIGSSQGPQIKYLLRNIRKRRAARRSRISPIWNPAHKTLLAAGIPTIENVGASRLCFGQSAAHSRVPLEMAQGDACVIRLVAIFDPSGNYRFESGMNTSRERRMGRAIKCVLYALFAKPSTPSRT